MKPHLGAVVLVMLATSMAGCGPDGAGSIEAPMADTQIELVAALVQDAIDELDLPVDALELDPGSGNPSYCTTDVEAGIASNGLTVRTPADPDTADDLVNTVADRWEAFGYDVDRSDRFDDALASLSDGISLRVSQARDGSSVAIGGQTGCEQQDEMLLFDLVSESDPVQRLEMLGIEPSTRQVESFD